MLFVRRVNLGFGGKAETSAIQRYVRLWPLSRGKSVRAVRRLPVTLLICADELCIGEYVTLHCSLDLRFRRIA
jgi:hypothetical protein